MNEEDDTAFKIGEKIGDYEVVSVLGGGATGTVYLTQHAVLKKLFAVKVLSEDLAFMPEFVRVFQHEAQIVAALTHENIVPVYNYGECNGFYYYVMDFVNGGTLEDVRKRAGGRLRPDIAVALMIPVARGLAYAHKYGVVHRDIKPENVLLTRAGTPQITDFGMAHVDRRFIAGKRRLAERRRQSNAAAGAAEKLRQIMAPPHAETGGNDDSGIVESQTQIAIEETATDSPEVEGGTEGYIAPEVARGNAPTTRADVYALGAMLHFLIVGETPAAAGELSPEVHKICEKPLADLIARSVSASPSSRFPTAQEFLDALERVAGAPARRKRRMIGVAAALAVLVAISVIFSFGARSQLRKENERIADTAREFFKIDEMREKMRADGREVMSDKELKKLKEELEKVRDAEAAGAIAASGKAAVPAQNSASPETVAGTGDAVEDAFAGKTASGTDAMRTLAEHAKQKGFSEDAEREYWEHFCEERTGRKRVSVKFKEEGTEFQKLARGVPVHCLADVPEGTYNAYLRTDGETPESNVPMRLSVGTDQISRIFKFSGLETAGRRQFFAPITVSHRADIVHIEIPEGARGDIPKIGIIELELRPTFTATDFSRMFGEFLSVLSSENKEKK